MIVCIGDSNTAGYGASPGHDYPAILQRNLGVFYRVKNAGISGSSFADYPIEQTLSAVRHGTAVVMLGTNDTQPIHWIDGPTFVGRCVKLVSALHDAKARRIFLMLPPAMLDRASPQVAARLEADVLPGLERCAALTGASVLDAHAALGQDYLIGDGVHLNDQGSDALAELVTVAVRETGSCSAASPPPSAELSLLFAVLVLRQAYRRRTR